MELVRAWARLQPSSRGNCCVDVSCVGSGGAWCLVWPLASVEGVSRPGVELLQSSAGDCATEITSFQSEHTVSIHNNIVILLFYECFYHLPLSLLHNGYPDIVCVRELTSSSSSASCVKHFAICMLVNPADQSCLCNYFLSWFASAVR